MVDRTRAGYGLKDGPEREGTRARHGLEEQSAAAAALELAVFGALGLVGWYAAVRVHALGAVADLATEHAAWRVEELVTAGVVVAVVFGVFAFRRWRAYRRELERRIATEAELEALERVIPICASCRRIRHEEGWLDPEVYVSREKGTAMSHGLCPECVAALERE